MEPGRRLLTGMFYQTRMLMNDEYGAVGGLLDMGDRSNQRKPARVPLRPPQIPYHLKRTRTQAATTEVLSRPHAVPGSDLRAVLYRECSI
jgi:hypothetical protein